MSLVGGWGHLREKDADHRRPGGKTDEFQAVNAGEHRQTLPGESKQGDHRAAKGGPVAVTDTANTTRVHVCVEEVVRLLNDAEGYAFVSVDEKLAYLEDRAQLLHQLVDVFGDERGRYVAQDADDRAERRNGRTTPPLGRSESRQAYTQRMTQQTQRHQSDTTVTKPPRPVHSAHEWPGARARLRP